MIDIFKNYRLQREELLARIAQEIQLDNTRIQRMEQAYKAVSNVLKKDDSFFKDLEIEIYAQGSKRIGATIKPINGDDFDLDTVLHIYDLYLNHSPEKVYNELVRVIENDSYYKTICEKKSRCVRLNYKGDFHIDILPACMPDYIDKEKIAIPEKKLRRWSSGNPKGFANWFLNIANSMQKSMLRLNYEALLEAKVESEPLPEEIYYKTPLQRAVQLVKRYRDIHYNNRDYPVSSIVLTTLIARYYDGEDTIYDTIDNSVNQIKNSYLYSIKNREKFKVLNPVDPEEDFTDSWTEKHYESFYNFISNFYNKWQRIKKSFEEGGKEYIELFGEGLYKKSLSEQIRMFSNSSKSSFTKANGLILGGSSYTDSKGQINQNIGVRNEPYHNFGGKTSGEF